MLCAVTWAGEAALSPSCRHRVTHRRMTHGKLQRQRPKLAPHRLDYIWQQYYYQHCRTWPHHELLVRTRGGCACLPRVGRECLLLPVRPAQLLPLTC